MSSEKQRLEAPRVLHPEATLQDKLRHHGIDIPDQGKARLLRAAGRHGLNPLRSERALKLLCFVRSKYVGFPMLGVVYLLYLFAPPPVAVAGIVSLVIWSVVCAPLHGWRRTQLHAFGTVPEDVTALAKRVTEAVPRATHWVDHTVLDPLYVITFDDEEVTLYGWFKDARIL